MIAALTSCSSSTTPSGTTDTTPHTPGVGSWFVVNENSGGGALSTKTYHVVNVGLTYFGKSNAVVAIDTIFGTTDTVALAYESNGDVSLFLPRTVGSWKQWVTLPFKSQTTMVTRDTDAATATGSSIVASGRGSSSFLVAGTMLSTESARLVTTITGGIPTIEDFHFAPTIGLIAMDSVLADQFTYTTERKLVGYSLK